ncbi:MAG: sensor histidine kinase [Winogradskyella sp.]|nr:sensor histidine kinase [Winogradskyella sp.]
MSKILLIALVSSFIVSTSFAQNEVDDFFSNTEKGLYKEAIASLNTVSNSELHYQLKAYYDIVKDGNYITLERPKTDSLSLIYNVYLINKSIALFAKSGKEMEAFILLKESANLAKLRNDKILICLSNRYILEIYERFHIIVNDATFNYFIDDYRANAYNEIERVKVDLYDYRINQRFNYSNTAKIKSLYYQYYKKLETIKSPFFSAKRDLTHFLYHQDFTKNLDSSTYFINKALKALEKETGYFEQERYIASKINLASNYVNLDNPELALEILNSITIEKDDYLYTALKKYIAYKKYLVYEALGNTMESYKNLSDYLRFELDSKQLESIQLVSEYEEKYQTVEKEKQLLIEKQKKKTNKNIAFGLGGSLALGSVIAFLLFKDTKRKQKFAEQEKTLESQKLATVLKEQELISIDAMIEGQEKERQRIANDLHDDLGGLMATVKLHFNALKDNNSPELYSKTNSLIDEAYQKVRSVAHAKNSGVIAKEGLLKAVQDMADKVTLSNTISIEVLDYGLDNRLENSLELTLFRIIQELITNVIKHAEATEVTIHLTNHDDLINIMVEDNGKGFDPNQITKTKAGMGISSIDKRIAHLDGQFTIESEKNKGTTIIIDIPL